MTYYELPNDDITDVQVVRPSSYGYAQPDPGKRSRKKKHPIGFAPWPDPPKRKPRKKTSAK